MTFLINCTNLKNGGGLQVADSIIKQLYRFPQYNHVVVMSSILASKVGRLHQASNIIYCEYNIGNNLKTLLLGRDKYLDDLVRRYRVNAVLTIFGPSRWIPQIPHLCGFARAQLVLKDSPYFKRLSFKTRIIYKIWEWAFRRSSDKYYTENAYISKLLPQLLGNNKRVFTVSNYYNQVFDHSDQWSKRCQLPSFNGCTLLTVSSCASHKNLPIMVQICEIFKHKYPAFSFRFVLTVNKEQCTWLNDEFKKRFIFLGRVDVSECPYLYHQADIMFMPTLLECFTATYPEAMRMEVPIVTTDLEFAHGLCGDAACYYSAVDPEAAAKAIFKVATDKVYARQLTEAGKKQLLKFDNYEQRADKLINILDNISKQ
jgi:glycosyltransferase involved in cell wall biosynthesis